jgi:hypothetical protein
LIDEFLKNPIGYYGHDKLDGVLLKWEDVRVEGDKILGKPVINLEHPRAERTIQEIEDGFLKAASVGGIVVLEFHLEDHPQPLLKTGGELPEPVLVVDKWYNKECSLVDSPANRDAFAVSIPLEKVELYDREEKTITIQDLKDEKGEKDESGERPSYAKATACESGRAVVLAGNVTLSVSPELIALLNLGDHTDEGSILAAVKDLSDSLAQTRNEKAALITELENERKSVKAAEVKAILDRGLSDGKYTAATRAELEGQFECNPASLRKLVDTMQPYKSITDRLNVIPAEVSDLGDMSYDDLDKANKLQLLKEKAPDLYKEKYKAKFNKEPK